jgi:hypothetical protein
MKHLLLFFAIYFPLAYAAEPAKIVLIAGTPSHLPGEHEFNNGILLLDKCLRQNKGVTTVVVKGGWPQDESVFDGAKEIVFYMDGGDKHPIIQGDHLKKIGALAQKGVGIACMHYAVEVPATKGRCNSGVTEPPDLSRVEELPGARRVVFQYSFSSLRQATDAHSDGYAAT